MPHSVGFQPTTHGETHVPEPEPVPRRYLAAAQSLVALGVTARLHFLYVTTSHAPTAGGKVGVMIAMGLAACMMVVNLLVACGLIAAGATRLKLGAALYAGIAALVCITYTNDPWDAQLGAAGVYGGLSVWNIAALIELRNANWWVNRASRMRRGS